MITLNKLYTFEEITKMKWERRPEDKKEMTLQEYTPLLRTIIDKNVPPRFKNCEVTDEKINDFIFKKPFSSQGKGLYIWGDCGIGKTRNLYGIYAILYINMLEEKIQNGESLDLYSIYPKITNITDFFSNLKKSFDNPNSEIEIVEAIKTPHVLLIDDFGTEKMSEWTAEATYRLINHRYEYMKPTFISSNLSLKQLGDRVGDRIVSRIVEMCDIIKLEGEDKRLKK